MQAAVQVSHSSFRPMIHLGFLVLMSSATIESWYSPGSRHSSAGLESATNFFVTNTSLCFESNRATLGRGGCVGSSSTDVYGSVIRFKAR